MSQTSLSAKDVKVLRWTPQAAAFTAISGLVITALVFGPLIFRPEVIDRLTTLFIYILLASMWNAVAGYGGLVSIGQQAFLGLGAYALIRLSNAGVNVYVALVLAVFVVGLLSIPIGQFMLKLRGGEFAIGMWVLSELLYLLVTIDPTVQGETGTSLIAMNSFSPAVRRADNYWMALAFMVVLLCVLFFLLRGRIGASLQAVRDDETAAASIGVNVFRTKHVLFFLSAVGCAAGGALWLATSITFQPRAFFSPQWTAYMLFMTIVGGLGTFEGPIIGAIIFFIAETYFGATGVVYLIGLGALAIGFALGFPRGIWGAVEARFSLRFIPIGYHLRFPRRKLGAKDLSQQSE
ncbi:MAG: branched-chain amino acid ABC transporter permease [Proteobacteria bacterium]|nr:branched-chain amino acid ABC transporter permease [Pseudomonadota bacterium]